MRLIKFKIELNNGIIGETGPKEQEFEYSVKFTLKEISANRHWTDAFNGRLCSVIKILGTIIGSISYFLPE